MSYKARICFTLAALLLASATLALASHDPEQKQCEHQCRSQQTAGEEQVRVCIRRCEDYDSQKHGGRGRDEEEDLNERSPIERLRDCNKRCEKQQQGERQEGCQKLCQQEYDRERETYEERERQHRGGGGSSVKNLIFQ